MTQDTAGLLAEDLALKIVRRLGIGGSDSEEAFACMKFDDLIRSAFYKQQAEARAQAFVEAAEMVAQAKMGRSQQANGSPVLIDAANDALVRAIKKKGETG